jgi:hypothetical protein
MYIYIWIYGYIYMGDSQYIYIYIYFHINPLKPIVSQECEMQWVDPCGLSDEPFGWYFF